jgi:hypothetical protein
MGHRDDPFADHRGRAGQPHVPSGTLHWGQHLVSGEGSG